MYKNILILTILLLHNSTFAADLASDMPIYDKGVFEDISKKSNERDEYGYEFKTLGSKKRESSLTSTAANVACRSAWKNEVLKQLTTTGFPGDKFEAEWWWGIQKVNDINPLACAVIYYPNTSVLLQYFKIDAVQKFPLDRKILLVSKYDKDTFKIGEVLYAGLANNSQGDFVRELWVKAIADIDADSLHEIIVYDGRYAGDGYIVFKLKGTSLEKKHLNHHSGD